jgi:HD-GYP domain-containing protein (c-di-GMP phosphodiesterase class II)
MAFKVRFQVSIAMTILVIIVALTAAIVSSLYLVSSRVAEETAGQLFSAVADGLYERIENQMGWTLGLARLGAAQQGLDPLKGHGLDAPILPFMFTVLDERPSLYSLYYGLENGDFFQVIATRGDSLIVAAHGAPAGTRWIVRAISVQGPDRIQRWSFLDTGQALLGTAADQQPAFDPRRRPWYEAAKKSGEAELSKAYVFHSLARLGITASKRFAGGVFGVDITLAGLDEFLKDQVVSPAGGLVIFDSDMRTLAMTPRLATDQAPLTPLGKIDHPMIRALVRIQAADRSADPGLSVAKHDGVRMMVHLAEWKTGGRQAIGIAVMAPTSDFTEHIRALQGEVVMLALACLVVFLIVSVFFARGLSVSVQALAEDALRIQNLDFSGDAPRPSHIIEFNDLGEAFSLMKQAIADKTRALTEAQEKLARLVESIIQLIASAIDAKSPYTGGHCERVPELALMLAEEAVKKSEGTLADFRFDTEEQWREFRIGAWLHDCGKLVTPEHIVDKATKLETIYNRIHEVRMRYEVLLRDADIVRLETVAAGGDPDEAQAVCLGKKAKLLDDFRFIAECNLGSEDLSSEKIERLRKIAKTTWLRHIDDRRGLSHVEIQRFGDGPPRPLPAVETVLADKPWHIIPRDEGVNKDYTKQGFKVEVPKNLYNQGEIHNLSVVQGTLTEEDRFKIDEHIMLTIIMLEGLAFPKHLSRVPEYAGTHHETLDGSGYPRKLNADQLSVPSRIMAIADIFEALTAADRPYRKPTTLSEAVDMLHSFKIKGHIDPDLFDLFLTSGLYERYAERFLKPEQIDEVAIEQYL